jgi:serine/threonine-protein kinase HipA
MRKAAILFKDKEAGELTQHDDGTFTFAYIDYWIEDNGKPDISLTLPKAQKVFHSISLHPFFYNMLPEGSNRQVVCKQMGLDPADDFGLLMANARYDAIGAVRVIKTEGV